MVADFNGDGKLDIAVGLNGITFVPGEGNGKFGTAVNTPSTVAEVPVAVADFNGDGKIDILDNVGNIVIGNGDGTFQPSFGVVGQQVGVFLPALLGSDKYPDILIGDSGVAVVVNKTK